MADPLTIASVRSLRAGWPERPSVHFRVGLDGKIVAEVRDGPIADGEAEVVGLIPSLLANLENLLVVVEKNHEALTGSPNPPTDAEMVALAQIGGSWSCVTSAGGNSIATTPADRDCILAAIDLTHDHARWWPRERSGRIIGRPTLAAGTPAVPTAGPAPSFANGHGVFVRAQALLGDAIERARGADRVMVQLLAGTRSRPTAEAAMAHVRAGGEWLVGTAGSGSSLISDARAAGDAVRMGTYDVWLPVLDGRPLLAPMDSPPSPAPPPRVHPPSDAELCAQQTAGRMWKVTARTLRTVPGWGPRVISMREAHDLRSDLRATNSWCLWWSCDLDGADAPWPQVGAP